MLLAKADFLLSVLARTLFIKVEVTIH